VVLRSHTLQQFIHVCYYEYFSFYFAVKNVFVMLHYILIKIT